MAKTLESIQLQIQKLQEQANAIKRKEAVGVIERIKTAIEAYGLTPDDLFGDEATAKPLKRRAKSTRRPIGEPAGVVASQRTTKPKKAPNPPKFTDGNRFWTGQGKRPQWYKDAIESGKTPDDMAVKAD